MELIKLLHTRGRIMNDNPIIPTEDVYLGSGSEQVGIGLEHVQRIFREITNKTDTLSKRYETNFRMTADDINQLNSRIRQVMEQYTVKTGNCSVTVHFVNDTQQRFGSFDSFSQLSAASTACVRSVDIRYDVLIVQPVTRLVQTFELTVRLNSRVAAQKQLRESSPFMLLPRGFSAFVSGPTAVISVKHVDYTIAQTLLDAADRWLMSCSRVDYGSITKILKKKSRQIYYGIHYGVSIVAAIAILYQLPSYLPPKADALSLATVLLVSFFLALGLNRVAFHLARMVEDAIDDYFPISYVSLTRGDKAEIEKAESSHSHNWIRGLVAFGAAIAEAAAAKYIVAIALAIYSSR